MSLMTFDPQKINTPEDMKSKQVVTSEHWNNMLNLLISQGNNANDGLLALLTALAATTAAAGIGADVTSVQGKTVQAILTAFETSLADRYTKEEIDILLTGLSDALKVYISNTSIPLSQKGAPNGVLALRADGLADPTSLPPALGSIPYTEKNAANGVAALDETGKLRSDQTRTFYISEYTRKALGLTYDLTTTDLALQRLSRAFGLTTGYNNEFCVGGDLLVTVTDGTIIRMKLHTDMQKGAKVIVGSNYDPKPIVDALGKPVKAKAGSYLTAIYSDTTGNFIVQGSGGDVPKTTTNQKLLTNTMVRRW